MQTYNTQLVEKALKFLNNANVQFDLDVEDDMKQATMCIDVNNNRIWTSGDSLWNEGVKKGVKVDYINLIADYDFDDKYWSGGLAGTIAYDGSGKDGTWYDGADVENNTLINKIKHEQDSDGMIYTDDGFIANCKKYMAEHCDFDVALLDDMLDFDYSEQGMQDDGAVNLDVDMDADFWQHCNDELVKFTATKVA